MSDDITSDDVKALVKELQKLTRQQKSDSTDSSRRPDLTRFETGAGEKVSEIKERIETLKKEAEIRGEMSRQEERSILQLEEQKRLAEQMQRLRDEKANQLEKIKILEEELEEATGARKNELQDLIIQEKIRLEGMSDYEDKVKDLGIDLERLRRAQNAANKEAERGSGKFELLSNKFLKVEGAARDFAEHIPMSVGELVEFGLEMADAIKSGEIFVDVFKKLIAEGFNLSMALDEVNAKLSRTNALFQETGTIMDQQARVIRGVESSNRILGATAAETGQAMGVLQSSMADFTRMSKSDRESILNTVTLMQELEVSAGTSAQIFDKATKSLGYHESQLRGIADELHATAQSLGVPFSQIADDFNMVATELAFYGETAIDVFKDLSKQSKATGLSMQQLLKIGGQAFNTFDGAAQKVGRLNAILGGPYLNSIDMLNASEAERIDLIKQSMDASGQMFSDLSKYEQMAIADALGVSTEEARRLFGELSAAEEMDIRQKEKMEETARKAQATMDKLKNAFMSLVVSLDPVVGRISKVVEGLSKYIDENGKAIKIILYSVSAIGTLIVKFLAFRKASSFGGRALKFLGRGLLKVTGYAASAIAIFNGLVEAINTFFKISDAGGGLGDYLGGIITGFFKGVAEVVDFLTGGLLGELTKITDVVGGLGLDFKEAWELIDFSFIGETILYPFEAAGRKIKNFFGFGQEGGGIINTPKNPKKVNDMILTSDGDMIQPSKQDTIFAAQPGGPIMESLAEAMSPLSILDKITSPLSNLAVKTSEPIMESLAEATSPLSNLAVSVTSPILSLLGGETNNTTNNNTTNNAMSQQPSNTNVIVKVGERELRDIFIDVLRDTTASSEISGFGGR